MKYLIVLFATSCSFLSADVGNAQATINAMKIKSVSEMAQVISRETGYGVEDSLYISVQLVKHHDKHKHDNPIKMGRETVEGLRKEAEAKRDKGLMDALKGLEDLIDKHPSGTIEKWNNAWEELTQAFKDYDTWRQMDEYFQNGQYESWGNNGLFLGPNN